MPKRIQLSRKKGWRKPEGAVVVSRPSKFGNPFIPGELHKRPRNGPGGRMEIYVIYAAHAVDLFKRYMTLETMLEVRQELRGKDLCCWCPLDQPCHADVLLELANADFKR